MWNYNSSQGRDCDQILLLNHLRGIAFTRHNDFQRYQSFLDRLSELCNFIMESVYITTL